VFEVEQISVSHAGWRLGISLGNTSTIRVRLDRRVWRSKTEAKPENLQPYGNMSDVHQAMLGLLSWRWARRFVNRPTGRLLWMSRACAVFEDLASPQHLVVG
jgi:hypothetical protein